MFECLILGDSIAEGLAQYAPACHRLATSGITTKRFSESQDAKYYWERPTKKVIISLGSNDAKTLNATYQYALRIRQNLTAHQVIWVLPSAHLRPQSFKEIYKAAGVFGDYVVAIPSGYLVRDGIHLSGKGYKTLTNWLLQSQL